MGPVDVAIVGGGAGGTLVAVQLLRQARGPWHIALVERSGALARGLAYGPAEPCHLLNLPAAGMSALPDDPGHFVRWSGAAPDAFVPRARAPPRPTGALDGTARDVSILLLGTGLTMVDAALALQRRGHRGTIHALSRHGLLPQVHGEATGPVHPRIGASGVRGLLRALRAASQRGGDWRAAFDA